MATATVPTLILGGLSAASSVSAGKSANKSFQASAEQEGLAAKEREIVRRENLLAALGTINANAAASGIAREGSVANLRQVSTRNTERNVRSDEARTRLRQQALINKGKASRRRGLLGAATTFLGVANGGET